MCVKGIEPKKTKDWGRWAAFLLLIVLIASLAMTKHILETTKTIFIDPHHHEITYYTVTENGESVKIWSWEGDIDDMGWMGVGAGSVSVKSE